MTELAAALADTSCLPNFEGLEVRRAGIEIPGVAGGLRDAIRIEPRAFRQGDTAWIALEVRTQKIRHQPIDKDEPAGDQERVHVFEVLSSSFVDAGLVEASVRAAEDRIARAREQAKGIQRLEGIDPSPYGDQLQDDHDAGDHDGGLVDGCPACDYEAVLAAADGG